MKEKVSSELGAAGGLQLYRKLRAGLLLKGMSFRDCARQLGVDDRNLARAVQGEWDGPRARELRFQACRIAEIDIEGFNDEESTSA